MVYSVMYQCNVCINGLNSLRIFIFSGWNFVVVVVAVVVVVVFVVVCASVRECVRE